MRIWSVVVWSLVANELQDILQVEVLQSACSRSNTREVSDLSAIAKLHTVSWTTAATGLAAEERMRSPRLGSALQLLKHPKSLYTQD